MSSIETYSPGVARKARPSRGPRPAQGAHLLALRKKAGLTQTELAEAVGESQGNITFWEWSELPPRSNVLARMAQVLGVRVDDLIFQMEQPPRSKRPGPVGDLQRAFEEVRSLPRSEQRRIIETVLAIVDRYRRKAG